VSTCPKYPEELPEEDWRPLAPPYQDWLISNYGRVWAIKHGKLLTLRLEARGDSAKKRLSFKLPTLGLSASPRRYSQTVRRVAREVLLTFVGPPPSPSHFAACVDGDEMNCHVSNLEWQVPHNPRWTRGKGAK